MKKRITLVGILLASLSYAQTSVSAGGSQTIEVESKGTITFGPDSFVVKVRWSPMQVNTSDEIEEPESVLVTDAMMDYDGPVEEVVDMADYPRNIAVEEAPVAPPPPPSREELAAQRERMRMEREKMQRTRDSLNQIKRMRALEFQKKVAQYGIKDPMKEREVGYEYSDIRWVQTVSTKDYQRIDSLSRVYGKPLRMEMLDIRMKDNQRLKEQAYRKAMENSKKEAEALAKAMDRKLGRVSQVKTENMGLEDLVPMMLRKELRREFRRSESFMQPALYQINQELGPMFPEEEDNDYGTHSRPIVWTWTESVKVTYQ